MNPSETEAALLDNSNNYADGTFSNDSSDSPVRSCTQDSVPCKYRVETLPAGMIGYKGTVLKREQEFEWPPPISNDEDWSGLYVGSLDQAKGNLYPDEKPTEHVSYLLEIPLISDIEMCHLQDEYLSSDKIKGEDKARMVKEKLGIEADAKLMPYLGDKNMAYKGPLTDKDEEIIIPKNLLEHTKVEIIGKYKISDKFELTKINQ